MKRKLLAVIAIIITMTVLFSGCSLIRPNAEREANQILATISADGITLYITQIEFMDYVNSNAQSVFQQYELEEGINFLLDKKIESKYLIIKAMSELKNYPTRADVTVNLSTPKKPQDMLTWGEYYYVVEAVNEQIIATVDEFIADYEKREASQETEEIDRENIASIEFVEGSFADEYYQGQKVDLKDVALRIIYEDGTELDDPVPVTEDMYIEEFSTEEAGVNTVVVAFEKKIIIDGEEEYEELTAEYEYNVIATRATKIKDEEEKEEIPQRYTLKADCEKHEMFRTDFTTDELYAFLGIEKEELKDNTVKIAAINEAYRRLKTSLKNQSRSVESLYDQAFESAVLSALNYEIGKTVATPSNKQIEDEYQHLIRANKESYSALSKEGKQEQFAATIASNLENVYYFPKVDDNIGDYFYVQQILFNFSDEQKAFLDANKGANDLNDANEWLLNYWDIGDKEGKYSLFNLIGNSIVTKKSNPDYDPEDEDSYPFEKDENDKIVERNLFSKGEVQGIYEELQEALSDPNLTAKDKLAIFDDYKYLYNDDPGIMNNETGYLIPPEGVQSGFYASFVELGRALLSEGRSEDNALGNAFNKNGELLYCYTDYGVHILMISLLPFEDFPTGDAFVAESNEQGGSFDMRTALDLKGTTFENVIKDKLLSQTKAKAYEDFAKAHLENAKEHGKIETKKINKILKQLKG